MKYLVVIKFIQITSDVNLHNTTVESIIFQHYFSHKTLIRLATIIYDTYYYIV